MGAIQQRLSHIHALHSSGVMNTFSCPFMQAISILLSVYWLDQYALCVCDTMCVSAQPVNSVLVV